MVSPPHPHERALSLRIDPQPTLSIPSLPGQVSMSSGFPVSASTPDLSQPSSSPLSSTGIGLGPSPLPSSSTSTPSTPISTRFAPGSSTGSSIPSSHSPSRSASDSANAGAIAGGVVGGVAAIALIAALVFLWLRRRSSRDIRGAGGYPPSPRMKSSPWVLPTIRPRPRKERLGSLEGAELARHASNGSYPSRPTPAHGSDSRPASELPPHFAFRNLSYSSGPRVLTAGTRESFPITISPVLSNVSYDTDGYNNGSIADGPGIRQSFPVDVDPFGSHSSIPSAAAGAAAGASGVRRALSTNRVTRKPVPTFDGNVESLGRSESVTSSNAGASRPGSNSSSAEKNANASNVSLNTHGVPEFKFAGGKEGPVHYLIPDMPPHH